MRHEANVIKSAGQRIRVNGAAGLILLAAAAALAGCMQSGPAASGSSSPAPQKSMSRVDFTPQVAAQAFDAFMQAIGSKDAARYCRLDSATATTSPQRKTPEECQAEINRQIQEQSGYWRPGQAQLWAGVTAVPGAVAVNDKYNYVFDSLTGGLSFGSGEPAACAVKDGCWFVVIYDQGSGSVSVEQGTGDG